MKEENKIIQRSVGLEKRQLNFIKYCEGKTFESKIHNIKVIFKFDKFVRDNMDKQIETISIEYPEVSKFLGNKK